MFATAGYVAARPPRLRSLLLDLRQPPLTEGGPRLFRRFELPFADLARHVFRNFRRRDGDLPSPPHPRIAERLGKVRAPLAIDPAELKRCAQVAERYGAARSPSSLTSRCFSSALAEPSG